MTQMVKGKAKGTKIYLSYHAEVRHSSLTGQQIVLKLSSIRFFKLRQKFMFKAGLQIFYNHYKPSYTAVRGK